MIWDLKAADGQLREQQHCLLIVLGPLLDLTPLLDGTLRPPVTAVVRALSARYQLRISSERF